MILIDKDAPRGTGEMDATCCYGFENPEAALAAQRHRYNELVGTCLLNGSCESITVWGLTDRQSWLNKNRNCDAPTIEPWPLLFDKSYHAKPAWWGMFDALNGCFDRPH